MIGIRSTMASIPLDGEVQKAPVIQRAALCCIFVSSVVFLIIGMPLKNHSWNLYRAMGKMQILYRSCFWIGKRPCEEFPRIFIALRVERHFVI